MKKNKLIKSNILESIITKTTNKMMLEGFTVYNNSYYLRLITLYTELNNNGHWYIAVSDDYLLQIKNNILNQNKKEK